MLWDVIECNGVWLNSASSQFPNLIAACSVEEMLVMSSVWHRDCWVGIIPRELWEFREALESEILGNCPPTIYLIVEIRIESRPATAVFKVSLHRCDTLFNRGCCQFTKISCISEFCYFFEWYVCWIKDLSWKARLWSIRKFVSHFLVLGFSYVLCFGIFFQIYSPELWRIREVISRIWTI